jgi:hypothetical protein
MTWHWIRRLGRARVLIALVISVVVVSEAARAQCGPRWLPMGSGSSGPQGEAYASVVMPNGDLIVGGTFRFASGLQVNNIARFDGTSWSALGSGTEDTVLDLAVTPAGELIAGGLFATAGGVPARGVARWDGTSWSSLGQLPTGAGVYALTVLGNGQIVAGGIFPGNVAAWDGQAWSTLGSVGGFVGALAVASDGALIAGGSFPGGVARWDGSSWTTIAGGVNAGGYVTEIFSLPGGRLVVGGSFTSVGGVAAKNVARWDGAAWNAYGNGLPGGVFSLWADASGNVTAGTAGQFEGVFTSMARWNGASWVPLGPPLSALVHDLIVPYANRGTLAVGEGLFSQGTFLGSIGLLEGNAWTSLGGVGPSGTIPAIYAIIPYPGAGPDAAPQAIVAGSFTGMSGIAANRIARWNGESHPLGSGMNGSVSALALMPNGDVVAGGAFTTAGSVPASNIARWDGSSWSPLGAGINGAVSALVVTPHGDLIAGGRFSSAGGVPAFSVARWNGSAWSAIGDGIGAIDGRPFATVMALAVMPDGSIVAGGDLFHGPPEKYPTAAGAIARWDGTTWTPMPNSFDFEQVNTLIVLPNGDLIAGGGMFLWGNVVRWNGSGWMTLGAGLQGAVFSLGLRPDGALVAAGFLPQQGHVAVWDGTQWTGAFPGSGPNNFVNAIAFVRDELTLIGGGFTTVAGLDSPSPRFAVYSSSGNPWLVAQPEPQSAPAGGSASFSVRLAPGFTFASGFQQTRWLLNGSPIVPGTTMHGTTVTLSDSVTEKRLILGNLSSLDAGSVSFSCPTTCGPVVSTNPVPLTVLSPACPGDADGSNTVTFLDITTVLANFGNIYGAPPATGPGDADRSGSVAFLDITTVLANFGNTCQ